MSFGEWRRAAGIRIPWAFLYRGDARACPCCDGQFRAMRATNGRPEALCPRCGALERHRLLWLFIEREVGVERLRGRMLHVAPEPALEQRLTTLPDLEYVRGDLLPARAEIRRLDVTAIDFPDESFDTIVVNHVLEHVPDDRRAIAELRRVLKPGGLVLTQHPYEPDRAMTYEDAAIVSETDRLAHFGQADHVRIYGRDFVERLREGGFSVETRRYAEALPAVERERFALMPLGRRLPGDDIHVLR